MKVSLCIVLLIIFASCHSTHEIYIVRHAEKSTEPANDPHLMAEGKQRAEDLKAYLENKKIKSIFSTETNRTIETGTPLSLQLNVSIEYYSNDTLSYFLQRVLWLKKNVLIVGHSNTSVMMLDQLKLPHTITFIPDNDYDNMAIIKVKNGRAIGLTETTYGAFSPSLK